MRLLLGSSSDHGRPLKPRKLPRVPFGLLALSLSLTACVGNVAGSLGDAGGVETPLGNNGGSDGPFLGTTDDLEATGLRRLNAEEYDATVRDLLGSKLTFRDTFLSDETSEGFDTNASALGISTSRLQTYQLAAEALATELVTDSAGKLAALAPCTRNASQESCLAKFVAAFATRAWRRPLTEAETTKLVADASDAGKTYAAQVQLATTAILMSPYFLYRIEIGEGRKDNLLNPYELATRLSYFLWSSMPDAQLTAAAADGSLLRDEVLDAQVTRMLKDEKAAALTDRFGGMWLGVRKAAAYVPDTALFPNFDADLQASAVAQTKATLNDLFAGKIPFHELYDGNTIYLNDRLAKHYGMPAPDSATLVKVPAGSRRGLLTQAATLMAESLPDRTSLVHRGVFVLKNITCASPPGAPMNVPPLPQSKPNAKTQRQRLEAHVAEPSCAVCHNYTDPYGYVLESYDAIGAFRTTDNGGLIDTSAKLSDGTRVANAEDLSKVLAQSAAVSSCLVQKLSTYAIGRTLTTADAGIINGLHAGLLRDDQRVDHLIHQLVLSPIFRRRG